MSDIDHQTYSIQDAAVVCRDGCAILFLPHPHATTIHEELQSRGTPHIIWKVEQNLDKTTTVIADSIVTPMTDECVGDMCASVSSAGVDIISSDTLLNITTVPDSSVPLNWRSLVPDFQDYLKIVKLRAADFIKKYTKEAVEWLSN